MFKAALDEFYKLKIEDIMKKTGYAVVARETPVQEVLEALIEFGHIWVTDFEGSKKVVGVIARKDFIEMALPPQFIEKSTPGRTELRTLYFDDVIVTAEDMMTRNVIKVEVDTSVAESLKLMNSNFLRQLPVVRVDELVGEISMRDLIRNYVELLKHKKKQQEIGCEE